MSLLPSPQAPSPQAPSPQAPSPQAQSPQTPAPQAPPAISPRRRDFQLEAFRQGDDRIASWQLINTLVPTALLWVSVPTLAAAGPALRLLLLPVLLRNTAARWPRHLRLQPRPAPHPRLCQQRVPHPLLSRITTASWARPCAFPSCSSSKSPPRSCWSRPRCTLHAAVRRQAPRPSTPRHPSAA